VREAVTRGRDGYLRVYYDSWIEAPFLQRLACRRPQKIPTQQRSCHDHAQFRWRRATSMGSLQSWQWRC